MQCDRFMTDYQSTPDRKLSKRTPTNRRAVDRYSSNLYCWIISLCKNILPSSLVDLSTRITNCTFGCLVWKTVSANQSGTGKWCGYDCKAVNFVLLNCHQYQSLPVSLPPSFKFSGNQSPQRKWEASNICLTKRPGFRDPGKLQNFRSIRVNLCQQGLNKDIRETVGRIRQLFQLHPVTSIFAQMAKVSKLLVSTHMFGTRQLYGFFSDPTIKKSTVR